MESQTPVQFYSMWGKWKENKITVAANLKEMARIDIEDFLQFKFSYILIDLEVSLVLLFNLPIISSETIALQ